MSSVTVSRIGERLVVVKAAEGDSAERIRSEARILQALDHPGLVQVVDVDDGEDSVVLRTAFAGPDTWASRPLDDPLARAAGIAAVAAIVADMHDRGVTHGSLTADHVIRGDDDRPILCSLSRSRGDGPVERGADIEALAMLIEQPPLPDGSAAAALGALARRMRAGGCDAPAVVAEANRIAAGNGHHSGGADRRRQMVGAAVVVAVAAGSTLAVAGATRLGGSGARPPAAPSGTRPELVAASTPASEPLVPATAAPSGPAVTTGPDDPVASGGLVLDHDGRRYLIGSAGDMVALGDWDCDGEPTPALLRPTTGEIAVFDRWPEPDATISNPGSWTITGATSLSAEPDGSCDRLRVDTAEGSRLLGSATPP
jgi:hypothetical protein